MILFTSKGFLRVLRGIVVYSVSWRRLGVERIVKRLSVFTFCYYDLRIHFLVQLHRLKGWIKVVRLLKGRGAMVLGVRRLRCVLA